MAERPASALVEVTLVLAWTYGISGPDGRTEYVGPGRVTIPLTTALPLGGNMATAVFHWQGKSYSAETLRDAPVELLALLRERGIGPPVAASQTAVSAPLTDIDGVGEELATALREAGYMSVSDVATADPDKLADRVAGVGPKSAPRLIDAAAQLSGLQAPQ